MAYKDILVFLDPSPDTVDRLELTIDLATRFSARVTGVDISAAKAFEAPWRETTLAIESSFRDRMAQTGLATSFRVASGKTESWKNFYTHYADLVVASEEDTSSADILLYGALDDVILNSGAPTLVLPRGLRVEQIGNTVLVAWKGSREAARAVRDAMPILKKAKQVVVFEYGEQHSPEGSDLQLMMDHLSRHSVNAEPVAWADVGETNAINALFACASARGADLIIAGGYSHSKFLEDFFGGVTSDLLKQPSLPVILSH